ncbi:MAG TPA: hypothetical protein VM938_10135 [Acidimicrobiales bacterium]|nr:hypothetical protein [Acidimicrobiales bacterium]
MQARRNLVWALAALLVIQVLHGLDELRTEEGATFFGTLADPGTILGVTGNVVALVAAVKGVSWVVPLAVATGVLVALGFVVVHGIPTATDATAPYWGDGSADALQWAGVIAVWIACAAVVVTARAAGTQGSPDSLAANS